jgi:hypothetical protein
LQDDTIMFGSVQGESYLLFWYKSGTLEGESLHA